MHRTLIELYEKKISSSAYVLLLICVMEEERWTILIILVTDGFDPLASLWRTNIE